MTCCKKKKKKAFDLINRIHLNAQQCLKNYTASKKRKEEDAQRKQKTWVSIESQSNSIRQKHVEQKKKQSDEQKN